jgi:hypothetical protein
MAPTELSSFPVFTCVSRRSSLSLLFLPPSLTHNGASPLHGSVHTSCTQQRLSCLRSGTPHHVFRL